MSSPLRALAILDLFCVDRPLWHPDEINLALGYSRATGYRYVKDLVEGGLLQRLAAGRYALGPRIVELDHRLRLSDPVLLAAVPVMDALALRSRFDVVLTAMFGDGQIVDTHRSSRDSQLQLRYGRGRPRPLLRGAAARVLLAAMPRVKMKRLHHAHADEIAALGLGTTWEAFRDHLSHIRMQGFYVSLGELDPGIGAMAVPLHNEDEQVVAALALVGTISALQQAGHERLKHWLTKAAADVRRQLLAADAARRLQ